MEDMSLLDSTTLIDMMAKFPKQQEYIFYPFYKGLLNNKQKEELRDRGYTYCLGIKVLVDGVIGA